MIKNKRVLVTGGCGFIGSHIAERLCADNEVIILDNLVSGTIENISTFKDKVEFVKADICDAKSISSHFKEVDCVFHEAANVFVQTSVENPYFDAEVNILGMLNVLEAARKHDVGRLVFAASSASYGEPKFLPITEDHPLNPDSPYAASKKAGEDYCNVYTNLYGLPTVKLRYMNVYGPRQDASSPYSGVISVFVDRIQKEQKLTIYGDGNQTRDFVNVKDVVDANLLAATKESAVGEVFNIGNGDVTTINELANSIMKIAEKKVEIDYKPMQKGDVYESVADISKAKEKLGFSPKMDLETGLRELITPSL